MRNLQAVQPFRDCTKVLLPRQMPAATKSFDEALLQRETARSFSGGQISLTQLAKILFMSYGITYSKAESRFPRDLRTIPSGGALYPLEMYFASLNVSELEPGLYHFNPEEHNLDFLEAHDVNHSIDALFVQKEPAHSAAAVLFIAAYFSRTTFKYGDRGYRFALLEAGHLAQNALLTASEMGLGCAPIGGYFDRDVDRYLGLDGINQSVVYVILLGEPKVNREMVSSDSGSIA